MLAVTAPGCLFVSSDVADFTFEIPEKSITVDTARWGLIGDQTFPEIPCEGMEGICSVGASAVCEADGICFGSCEEGFCKATILLSLANRMDLKSEVAALEIIDRSPLSRLTVDRITYSVKENTFSAETPPLEVKIGAEDVTSPGHPMAELVGTIPPVAPMDTFSGYDLDFSEDGRAALEQRLRDYTNPFNIVVGGTIELRAGDAIPAGVLKAVVQVRATAGL